MKRIAINALGLKNNTGGVETYTYNIVKALLDNDKDNKYFLFIGANLKLIFQDLLKYKNLKIISYPINTNNSTIRVITENTFLFFDLLLNKIDLVHHVCNYMPTFSPIKSVVTLHDMMAFFYQENYPEYKNMQKFYNYFKKAMAYTANHAEKIIAISEFTKSQFLKYYDVDENKIIVIGQSLDTRKKKYTPNPELLKEFDIKKPYLLSVSVIRPHKNFDFLIRVFNKLKEKHNIPHQLVIVGGIHFGAEKFLEEIENSAYKDDIKYLGYIKDEILSSIYSYADAFVFPSLNEGFGIPLLEAMEYNLPIISSDRASLPEVGGDSTTYFDPFDEDEACAKIYCSFNNNVKNIKSLKQANNLELFNWKKIGLELIEIYSSILK